ncbi:hypothetical protein LNI98_10625 [Tenacibaculum dicentrarchi]|uniref:hypothetical protein n=1 Tax=Tenacibaculum dicentrarchi TaxID=669041 RepID=UPI001BEC8D98|nr:hypothetical protein [Tenacibaculum dicentrarchi]MCD8443216.1 hypothetical protein [Tenacibaculum dicentrarchi]MCD8450150.1 hypothetical protein [Tenacibaculum dicentrarchi]
MSVVQLSRLSGFADNVSWDTPQTSIPSQGGGFSTPQDASDSGGGSKFWGGTNFMGLLSTIGGTWAQIEQAKHGKKVIVKDAGGNSQNIAPQLLQKLDQQAKANNTSSNQMFQMMQMQMMKQMQTPPPPKNNTALYIGLGVGGLILLTGVIFITSKKK